ncbi:DNA-processing protein DprA [Fulvivirgaceae bacterium PWU5]|uniref:DNA-processing protein DprA n=1 Tax=Dawidia cretensis TaxID=2782350 RepID=A0AAP2DW87_9BACT|nr:DNA-processing protein DprA [Dawidia cretensis]MBT1708541.1 DNA-processing protein DprA [Dawidia cretensis]
MDQNRLSSIALHFIPGIGGRTLRQLVTYCGSAQDVFRASRTTLLQIPGVGPVTADAIRQGRSWKHAEEELTRARKAGVSMVLYTDPQYPSRLRTIEDAPSLLYLQGNLNLEHKKIVAVVGTRRSTEYGTTCLESLLEGLAAHDALVLSGLAYGIDIQAHRLALKYGLSTVGVLGSGIDVIYPAMHSDTARKMLQQGGLVTENPFGTKPDAHNFPARNRIIAGLCDALVVVEAADKGGALITADLANGYFKDVFAYPGSIRQQYSNGCNQLIKAHKANLLTSVKDLEYIMNWETPRPVAVMNVAPAYSDYEPEEQAVLRTLWESAAPLMIDALSGRSGLPPGQLASILLTLELKGIITPMPGSAYRINMPAPGKSAAMAVA